MGNRPLKEELLEDPFRFEFFQAVRVFERMFPAAGSVGGTALPSAEPIRFRSNVALNFPSSEIHEIRTETDPVTEKEKYEILVNFMGMIGPSGSLPVHYTEFTLDRVRHRDTAMAAFLDIFTHRAVSMFYKAWAKYRFPVAYERGNDDFTAYLFDIAGLGTDGLRGRMGLEDESLLPYVGLISQKPHSATALESIIGDYFGIQVKAIQMYGQWLNLTKDDITYLGRKNSSLGLTALLGERVWDQQSKFRLVLGPLNFVQFQAFLPNGSGNKALSSIIRFMTGLELDFDVQLKLAARQVPGLVLTTRAKRRPMLGWTTWLKTEPFKQDDDQVVLDLK
ncbi:MAG: type VI secretion system baseplate subunit TssG [Acidobacteria bacterium]|nr:type VI secretion system baseplate subunit TssG [Acidobacteriota bacterium]